MGVNPDLLSGGSFRSSHSGHSHGTLENNLEVFLHFEVPCRTVYSDNDIIVLEGLYGWPPRERGKVTKVRRENSNSLEGGSSLRIRAHEI